MTPDFYNEGGVKGEICLCKSPLLLPLSHKRPVIPNAVRDLHKL
jgi:hypothetical protein